MSCGKNWILKNKLIESELMHSSHFGIWVPVMVHTLSSLWYRDCALSAFGHRYEYYRIYQISYSLSAFWMRLKNCFWLKIKLYNI